MSILLRLENGSHSTGHLYRRRPEVIWTIHDPENQDQKVTHWMNIDSIIEE